MRSKAQHIRSRSGLLRLRYVPQHAQHTPLGVLRCCALPHPLMLDAEPPNKSVRNPVHPG
jgi:hypothetical protein